ncbi:MAG: hypothetical protein OXJ38_01640 [Gammaproteobacteria bacterium]|nr:hypothetical protein [Gammaproteobacteria bacterium]MDE0611388.1 hypothetical protein [Gammaproteobacteria bacterium]
MNSTAAWKRLAKSVFVTALLLIFSVAPVGKLLAKNVEQPAHEDRRLHELDAELKALLNEVESTQNVEQSTDVKQLTLEELFEEAADSRHSACVKQLKLIGERGYKNIIAYEKLAGPFCK